MSIAEKYIAHLEKCFDKSERKESKLIPEIIDMQGMTGEMTRHFYNNLLDIDNSVYLEIGAWMGSSCCSAMYGNKANVTIIDNFSEFGDPKLILLNNIEKYKGDNDCTFIEADCFTYDKSLFKNKFNIYLYDGHHSEDCQYRALEYYIPVMEDVFIFIVDDWNWSAVRVGTFKSIITNGLEIVWKKEIRLTNNDEFTPNQEEAKSTWWNGIACFLLKKRNK